MTTRLSIKDSINYSLDKVDCFERSIVNQLSYKNIHYGNLFIILIKLYQFYFWQPHENHRRELIELSERILNIKYQKISRVKFSSIKKYLDQGYLPIIGGDLYSLFYSDHYKLDSWPHWFILTGCDPERKLYYLFDDMQYTHIDSLHGDICLTEKIIKTINKRYLSLYDKKWSCFVLEITDEISINEILRKILLMYSKFDARDKEAYPQIKLMKKLFEVSNNVTSIVFEELKRKVLNLNKYRTIFVCEVEKYMHIFEYSKEIIAVLQNYNSKLEKLWEQYVTSNILGIIKGKEMNCAINDEIVELEVNIKDILIEFSEFLLLKSNNITNMVQIQSVDGLSIENDKDGIVCLSENKIVFNFDKGRIYNWWFEDNAPKVVLAQGISSKRDFKITTKICINEGFTQKNFQVGIFLRFANSVLFCALDSSGLLVLDEVGKINKTSSFIFSGEVQITLNKQDDMIFGQIKDTNSNESNIEWYVKTDDCIDIGLSCKTWGESGAVRAEFFDYIIEFE